MKHRFSRIGKSEPESEWVSGSDVRTPTLPFDVFGFKVQRSKNYETNPIGAGKDRMNRMDKMSDSKITKRTHYGGQALQFRVSNLGLLSVFGHSGFGFGVLPKRTHFRLVSLVCIRGSTPIFTKRTHLSPRGQSSAALETTKRSHSIVFIRVSSVFHPWLQKITKRTQPLWIADFRSQI